MSDKVLHSKREECETVTTESNYKCTHCGKKVHFADGDVMSNEYYFCPRCGTRLISREKIKALCIADLKMHMELICFDPSTGEEVEPEQLTNKSSKELYETLKLATSLLSEDKNI